jgi:hypothetical protein
MSALAPQSGLVMLTVGSSPFDPLPTSRWSARDRKLDPRPARAQFFYMPRHTARGTISPVNGLHIICFA